MGLVPTERRVNGFSAFGMSYMAQKQNMGLVPTECRRWPKNKFGSKANKPFV